MNKFIYFLNIEFKKSSYDSKRIKLIVNIYTRINEFGE